MDYEVIRSRRRSLSIEIRDNRLIVRAPVQTTDEKIEECVQKHREWIEEHLALAQEMQKERAAVRRLTAEEIREMAEQALEVIPQRVAYYAPKIGVTYGKITIRNQRSKWGSCSSKGNLNFNCLLMKAPPEVLDSVVVHELCHRKEMNHSQRFYNEVLRVFPDYWKWDKWLKENGVFLMAMME